MNRIIYADPPWFYKSRAVNSDTRFGGGAAGHYEVMGADEIAGLGRSVRELADPDGSCLFMWAVLPQLGEAVEVMSSWGWNLKTVAFVWVKTYPKAGTPFAGPGFWTRSNAEIVLLGTRGKGFPRPVRHDVAQVLLCPHPRDSQGKIIHSRKPDEIRQRIVQLLGDLPRVELFAREAPEGWAVVGNQLGEGARVLVPDLTLFQHARREKRLAKASSEAV